MKRILILATALALIENGKVIRPQMGVTVSEQEGPDEPMSDYAPASVVIMSKKTGSLPKSSNCSLKALRFQKAVACWIICSERCLVSNSDCFIIAIL